MALTDFQKLQKAQLEQMYGTNDAMMTMNDTAASNEPEYGMFQDDPNSGMFDNWGKENTTFGIKDDPNAGLFDTWNQQSTANLIKGVGVGANIYFGAQNLGLAKKSFGIKEEQHKAWMEDRAEAKTKRDAVSAIRF